MNLQLSDIVSDNYQIAAFLLAVIAGLALGNVFYKVWKGDSIGGVSIFTFVAFAVTATTYGIGSSDISLATPYYERLSKTYSTFESQPDFWFQEDIRELAENKTIGGQPFDNGTSQNNEAITLLAKYFPSDEANIDSPETLRSARQSIKGCLPNSETATYIRRLSEIPVARSELDAIKKEVTLISDGSCEISA